MKFCSLGNGGMQHEAASLFHRRTVGRGRKEGRKGEGEEGVGVGTADGRTEIVRSAGGLVGRSRAGGGKTNKSLAGWLLALKRGHHSALNERAKHPVRYLT